jgi:hypothetical protein
VGKCASPELPRPDLKWVTLHIHKCEHASRTRKIALLVDAGPSKGCIASTFCLVDFSIVDFCRTWINSFRGAQPLVVQSCTLKVSSVAEACIDDSTKLALESQDTVLDLIKDVETLSDDVLMTRLSGKEVKALGTAHEKLDVRLREYCDRNDALKQNTDSDKIIFDAKGVLVRAVAVSVRWGLLTVLARCVTPGGPTNHDTLKSLWEKHNAADSPVRAKLNNELINRIEKVLADFAASKAASKGTKRKGVPAHPAVEDDEGMDDAVEEEKEPAKKKPPMKAARGGRSSASAGGRGRGRSGRSDRGS